MSSIEQEKQRLLNRLSAGASEYGCADSLRALSSLHRTELFTWLLFDRLERKNRLIEEVYERSGMNWNQTLYVMLFRTVGDVLNRDAFMELAWRVTYEMLLHERGSLRSVEAMIIGASGLLDRYCNDEYTLSLRSDYQYLAHKYSIKTMPEQSWTLKDVKPLNTPVLRMAQVSKFFADNEFVIEKVLRCRNQNDVYALLGVEASEYWNTHIIPSRRGENRPKRIGKFKSDMLAINLVAPLQYAFGCHTDRDDLRERALSLLENVSAEDNRYMRGWFAEGVMCKTAFESQALLQLYTEYCLRGRCEQCRVYLRQLRDLERK